MVGRRKWKSAKAQGSAQSLDVHREVELKFVERTPPTDPIVPEQVVDRLEPPETSERPTSDDSAPVGEPAPVEETGESEKEDAIATPTRKKPVRRRRGKKRKGPNPTVSADPDDLEGEDEMNAIIDTAEEPAKIQLVVPTPVTPAASPPALVVSDEILGMIWFVCSL
jgi:hypothetical protein